MHRYPTRINARGRSNSDIKNADTAIMDHCEISEGTKPYLDNLLRTTTAELKSEIDALKLLINTKNEQISELNDKVVQVVKQNVNLSSEVKRLTDNVFVKIDDLEQYDRKNNIRIEGIELSENETNAQLTKKVTDTLNSMGAEVTASDYFRLHRSGTPHTKNGKKIAQTIVRFRSWAARSRAYKTRYFGTDAERKARPFFVRQYLTKRRLNLLSAAQNALSDHPIAHAYVDSENNLLIINRSSKEKCRFNTSFELHEVLDRIDAFMGEISVTR